MDRRVDDEIRRDDDDDDDDGHDRGAGRDAARARRRRRQAPPAPASAPRERKPGEISPEMRKKLLGESVGLGGLPEKPMPSNIFLNVILGVTLIVVVAYAGGIRP